LESPKNAETENRRAAEREQYPFRRRAGFAFLGGVGVNVGFIARRLTP
jgi:hypothetical protein